MPLYPLPTLKVSILKTHSVSLLLLTIATIATFVASLRHDFVTDWDDQFYVTLNPVVWSLSIENIRGAFSRYFVGNYAPLHIVSYMFDSTLWGLRPEGFIATNILIHLCNGILFYFLMWKLTCRRLWALVAAALFLLHPVQVESVVWVSQRKNVLSMLFFLLSFHLYIAYRHHLENRRIVLYICSLFFFMTAVLSKSVVVILPLVLLVYDFTFLERSDRKFWILNKIPYFIVSMAIGIVSIRSQSPELDGGISVGWHGGSPLATFYTMLVVIVRYAKLVFWPSGLSAFYGYPTKESFDLDVILAGLFILLLVTIAVYVGRTDHKLIFWSALIFLGILPVLQIIPLVTFMNDRYLYFPMLGVAALLGKLIDTIYVKFPVYGKQVAIITCIVVLMALSLCSYERSKVWQNSMTLWSDSRAKFPQHPLPCFGLGSIYLQRGDLDRALQYFLEAYQLGMKTKLVVLNLGRVYLSQGNLEQAKLYATALVNKYPDYSLGLMLMGDYCRQAGDQAGADDAYRRAVTSQSGVR